MRPDFHSSEVLPNVYSRISDAYAYQEVPEEQKEHD